MKEMWIDVDYDNMNALQCSSCGSVFFFENGVDIRQDECPNCKCEMGFEKGGELDGNTYAKP